MVTTYGFDEILIHTSSSSPTQNLAPQTMPANTDAIGENDYFVDGK